MSTTLNSSSLDNTSEAITLEGVEFVLHLSSSSTLICPTTTYINCFYEIFFQPISISLYLKSIKQYKRKFIVLI